jgi:hypothetical protein
VVSWEFMFVGFQVLLYVHCWKDFEQVGQEPCEAHGGVVLQVFPAMQGAAQGSSNSIPLETVPCKGDIKFCVKG